MSKTYNSCFECDICSGLLVNPVVMPCGNVICVAHMELLSNCSKLLTNLCDEKKTFICGICKEEHLIPKNGFAINHRLKNLVDLELNNNQDRSPLFLEFQKEIDLAKENMRKLGQLEKKAENFIFDYFKNIQITVDLRRNDLKYKIDTYSDGIIKHIETLQTNFIKMSKEINQMTASIEKSKEELDKLEAQFNDNSLQDAKARAVVLNKEFHKIIADYQGSLIGNKEYRFEFKELSIEEICGRITDFRV